MFTAFYSNGSIIGMMPRLLPLLLLLYDLQTGCCDIVIGRDDGSLEVWDVDSQGQPQLVVSTQLPEGITTVDGGYITNAASPDIIVHTFTGKVSMIVGYKLATIPAPLHILLHPGTPCCGWGGFTAVLLHGICRICAQSISQLPAGLLVLIAVA